NHHHQSVTGNGRRVAGEQPPVPSVLHPALVRGREHVGLRALFQLRGEHLASGVVEPHRDAGMGPLERTTDIVEGLGERGGGEDGKDLLTSERDGGQYGGGEQRRAELVAGAVESQRHPWSPVSWYPRIYKVI